MALYRKRLLDAYLMDLFTELPALEIYGAKAAGKTSTAARFCIHNFKLDIQEAYDVVQGGLQTIEVLR